MHLFNVLRFGLCECKLNSSKASCFLESQWGDLFCKTWRWWLGDPQSGVVWGLTRRRMTSEPAVSSFVLRCRHMTTDPAVSPFVLRCRRVTTEWAVSPPLPVRWLRSPLLKVPRCPCPLCPTSWKRGCTRRPARFASSLPSDQKRRAPRLPVAG